MSGGGSPLKTRRVAASKKAVVPRGKKTGAVAKVHAVRSHGVDRPVTAAARDDIPAPIADRISRAMAGEGATVSAGRVRVPDVVALRAEMDLTQPGFAERFGLALSALQNWEQGRRLPDRTARILLRLIGSHPDAVAEAAAAEQADNPD